MSHYNPYTRKRAQKRLEGEDVSGARESPFKNYTGRKVRNTDLLYQVPPVSMPPMYGQQGLRNCFYPGNNSTAGNSWRADLDQGLPNAQQPTFMQSMFHPIRGSGFMEVSQTRQSQNALDSAVALSSSSTRASNRSYGDLAVDSKPKNAGSFLASSPIVLIVSNLDSSINSKKLQSILLNLLKQYAMVLNLTITTQSDGSPVANVKVGSQQEVQFVISQLHHQWLGCKRMSISCAQTSSDPNQVRFMIVSLLQEVPGNRMPLFKFYELAESRYHCAISLSEVNKLKDVCKITDGACGRTIVLTPEASISSPVCMYSEELSKKSSILAARKDELDAAAKQWKSRVEQSDAVNFSVAGRMQQSNDIPTIPINIPTLDRSKRTPKAKAFRGREGGDISSKSTSTPVSPEKNATSGFKRSISLPGAGDNESSTALYCKI